MNKLTNKEIIQLGAAVNKVMIERLYNNGMTSITDLAKFTGLKETIVNRIMKELELN